jgi:hypothetical protein
MKASMWRRGLAAMVLVGGLLPVSGLQAHASGSGCTSGQWSVMPSPAIPNGFLNATTALSANDVWAGGTVFGRVEDQPLFEHWDGGAWNVVRSPIALDGQIYAMAAASPDDIWAFGVQSGGSLVEHWNGHEWKVVPNTGHPAGELHGGLAFSSRDAWAIGTFGSVPEVFVEHWNGITWTLAGVFPALNANTLVGITGTSDHDVWVAFPSTSEHWDGSSWTASPLAPVGPGYPSNPAGMATDGSGEPWVAGSADGLPDVQANGAGGWSDASLPTVSTNAVLSGISATSSSDVWTVGYTIGTPVPIAMHWDGTLWTSVPPVSPTGDDAALAVAAVPGQVFTVGSAQAEPLIETYCP